MAPQTQVEWCQYHVRQYHVVAAKKNHLALSVSSPTTGCRQVCWTLCIVKLNGNPYRDLRNHRLPPAHLFQHIARFAWSRKNMWHCYVA